MKPIGILLRVVIASVLSMVVVSLPGIAVQASSEGPDGTPVGHSEVTNSAYTTSCDDSVTTDLQASTPVSNWGALPSNTREAILNQLRQAEYQPTQLGTSQPGTCIALNRANALSLVFDANGLCVLPAQRDSDDLDSAWRWSLRLTGYGYGETVETVLPAKPTTSGNRIEYHRGDLREWYLNDERGLEQGFTLASPPPAEAGNVLPLRIVLNINTSLTPKLVDNGCTLLFYDSQGQVALNYGKLFTYDVDGTPLPTRMIFSNGVMDTKEHTLYLVVDDRGANYPITIDPLLTQVAKLTASDGAEDDYFGRSVSISGDTLVVGAAWDDDNGTASGSAYVFERNQGGADSWGQVAKLTASDGAEDDLFGRSVSISGDTIVVGAIWDDDKGTDSGSAYVFERNRGGADSWGQVTKLLASDGASGDGFGGSVSISGDTIVVGAVFDDDKGTDSGSTYVFERNQGGADSWGQVAKLTASDGAAYDYFGFSVSISGDTLVVGAYRDDDTGTNSGSAYVFERNQGGADSWGQVTKLLASDGAEGDFFSYSVSISGDTIVVGAVFDDDNGSISGSTYVFERNQGGADSWGQVTKLLASDGVAGDEFGWSVSISGDTIIVSAVFDDDNGTNSGSAYVFERNQGGADSWGQVTKLLASDGAEGDFFGYSVSISGDTLVVGAYRDDDTGTDSGSAYTSVHCGSGKWLEERKKTASDGVAGDEFGWSVSISGDTIVVGAGFDDDNGSNSGSAYVLERNQGGVDSWGQVTKLLASDGASSDFFGQSVSISGDTIVVGARGDNDKGFSSGSAYVFERNQGGADSWGQVAKLTASDGAAYDYFGFSVSISGDTILIGAGGNGTDYGSAYVFERNQGGADSWGQVAKLTASDGADDDLFGRSVSISGDTIVVGAIWDDDKGTDSGSAYVFERNRGGADSWGQVTKLTTSDGASAFGRSVSISGDTIVVGAHGDSSAYVFERNQGGADSWGQVTKLLASDGASGDGFGSSVSISGDTLVVGEFADDDMGSASGSTYVFERNQGGADSWGQVTKLTASDGAAADNFGISVSISADTILIGARGDDDIGSKSGSVWVFCKRCLTDFGDAPDGPYPTLLINNGARHTVDDTTFLGSSIDTELDGQPDSNASGDDLDTSDDEDGVAFDTPLIQCQEANIQITASQAGKLDAWIDYNDDGDWDDPNERIFNNFTLSGGTNPLSITVPCNAIATDQTFARFRFSTDGVADYAGHANDGEVEDYEISIGSGQSCDLNLQAGWNFIGTPLDPDSTAIVDIFEPVAGDISEVYGIWSFMHTSPGAWYSCVPFQVGQEYVWPGDLTNLEPGMGCWVYATTQCVLTINGTPVEFPFMITLYPGWNQVSFPIFGETRTVADLFAGIAANVSPIYGIWTFDASTGQWYSCVPFLVGQDYFWPGDFITVYPGMSYWVYVDSECVLTINAQ